MKLSYDLACTLWLIGNHSRRHREPLPRDSDRNFMGVHRQLWCGWPLPLDEHPIIESMDKDATTSTQSAELKAFLLVLRRALLLVVSWIEDEYGLQPSRGRLGREGIGSSYENRRT